MDELKHEQERRGTTGLHDCQMCELTKPETSELGPEDAAELREALLVPGISNSVVIAILGRRGIKTTDAKVGNHRRRHLGLVRR